MKKNRLVILLSLLLVGTVVFFSCTKEVAFPEKSVSSDKGERILKTASLLPDCESVCIKPGSEKYFERSESKIVTWGGNDGHKFSKTVEIVFYNTETEFVIKARSTNGWSDLIINGISMMAGDHVAANVWGTCKMSLSAGWKACDPIGYGLQVTGNGPPVLFAVNYNLIGICSVCEEQFGYEKNFDGTYTFTYTPAEDHINANVVFTFAQADRVDVYGLDGWTENGQTRQKTMDLVKCKSYEWIVGLSPNCNGHSGISNLWTDFKINGVSKKNISESTPNITFECP
jgi:hypothetical protein